MAQCSAEGRQLEQGMREAPAERNAAEQATEWPFHLWAPHEIAVAQNAVPGCPALALLECHWAAGHPHDHTLQTP